MPNTSIALLFIIGYPFYRRDLMESDFDKKAQNWDANTMRLERAAIVANRIKETVPLKKSFSALEFGAGTGLVGFYLIDQIPRMTFADTSREMLTQVEQKISKGNHSQARIQDLSQNEIEGSYDLIFTQLTLHHIEDYRSAIMQLCQSLAPEGWICLCDLDKEDGTFHNGPVPHLGFDREEISEILQSQGVKVVLSDTVYKITRDRPEGTREYPLFIILGQI